MPEGTSETASEAFARWRRTGDTTSLGRAFDAAAPELVLIAARLGGRPSAEDLVQETFLRAIELCERWDEARPLEPWLVGILVRLARRQRERDARRIEPDRMHGGPTPSPVDEAEQAELAHDLARSLRTLPPGQRSALILNLVHGLGPSAIADALGEPLATVKSRLARGKRALRDTLPASLAPGVFGLSAELGVPGELLIGDAAEGLGGIRSTVVAAGKQRLAAAGLAGATAAGGIGLTGALLAMKGSTAAIVTLAVAGAAIGLLWVVPVASGPRAGATELAPAKVGPTTEGVGEADSKERVDAPRLVQARAPARTKESAAPTPKEGADPALRGRVVDESGEGLEGVQVLLAEQGLHSAYQDSRAFLLSLGRTRVPTVRDGVIETRTDAGGEFAFERPAEELRHVLFAWAPERGAADLVLEGPAPEGDVALVLPLGQVLSVRLLDSIDRSPIVGGYVSLYRGSMGSPIAWQQTDEEGWIETVPLPPDRYQVLSDVEGYRQSVLELARGQLELEIALEREPRLEATLVDRDGQPWTKAHLQGALGVEAEPTVLVSWDSVKRRSELAELANGRPPKKLDFDPFAGTVRGALPADHFGRRGSVSWLSVWNGVEFLGAARLPAGSDPASSREIVIDLVRPEPIALDLFVEGPTSWKASVGDMKRMDSGFEAFDTGEWSGTRARLSIPGNLAGKQCGLLVEAEGYVSSFRWLPMSEDGGAIAQEVTFRLPGGAVRGRVLGSDGRPPVSAAVVAVESDGEHLGMPGLARAQAGPDGLFELETLPAGSVRLLVDVLGHVPKAVEVELPLDEPLEIAMEPGRELTVRFGALERAQLRLLDGRGLPLLDDRHSGTRRYGGASLTVDASVRVIEAYDSVTRLLHTRAEVPVGDLLDLAER